MTQEEALTLTLDEEALHALLGKAAIDVGGTLFAPLMLIGHQLGLYKALANGDGYTSSSLAEATGTSERYVREWLRANAAGGYILYDAAADAYSMTLEQALLFANEESPAFVGGFFETALAAIKILPQLSKAFRTGEGVGWGEHDHALFHGVEQAFRPGYLNHLVQDWIPALDGVEEKLKVGARVADVGCGFGASTIIMARAFPNSTFIGIDAHEPSINAARERAREAGLTNVRFEVAPAANFNSAPYDFICTFDCLHDMGDPEGAAAHIRQQLRPDGRWLIVEPFANDHVEDNLNPVGRLYYSVSTLVCTPCSLDQEVGLALGAQAGEARLREVVTKGGFTQFRRAAETPFNLILEARP
ncbi:MAG: class I SAM-dependent methyltransferase [Rubricoccaceae bacterium]|nr:class I SAM-dependent methyltransferase [Rubricoccaceae bacterium]